MKRRNWTTLQRLGIFTARGGVCHLCNEKINAVQEGWELEHVIPLSMGGDDDEENLRPAHKSCHKEKTKEDKGNLSKAKNRQAKHIGAKVSKWRPLAGTKASGIRKRMDGTVEFRNERAE